jgi:hypothetical protein
MTTMKDTVSWVLRTFIFLSFFGCVSLGLNDTKVVRSKRVQFFEPGSPFVEQHVEHLDHLWRNPDNGNSISFLSECGDATDPDLQTIQRGILRGVDDLRLLSSNLMPFDSREALETRARGKVDGVETEMEIVVYKKNGCIYTLNSVGVVRHFGENSKIFAEFMDQFRAP